MLSKIKTLDKDFITQWLNNLLVIYAFMLPISQSIKATVFSVIIILFLIRGDFKYHLKKAFENKVVLSFVYLFIIYLLGLLWTDSQNIKEGLSWVKSIKYGLYLIPFYIFIDGRYIKKVLGAFILGMLVSELVSYGMILGIMPWDLKIGDVHLYTAFSLTDPSPFLHHIHYGVALSFIVVVVAQQVYLSNKPLYMKMLAFIFVLSASANIFMTGGRTGYLTFILLLSFLGIFYFKRYALVVFAFMIIVFGIAYKVSPIVPLKVLQTEKSLVELSSDNPNFETSLGLRAGLYYYGYKVIKENPIFGVGTGDSMQEIYKKSPANWQGRKLSHEHNQLFSVAVKLGLVGVLIFLNIYYQIFKYKQEDKELRFIMIFATLAVAFGTLSTQFNLRFFMPFWVVMLAITLISKDRKTIFKDINERKVLQQIIVAGGVFSLIHLGGKLF